MTTFTWDCKTVDAYPSYDSLTDVVYNVHWIVNGEREHEGESYSGNCIGTIQISLADISPDTFIPIDQLTNEVVVGWTKVAMGPEEVASIEANVDAQIDNKITPQSITITLAS